MTAAWAVFSFSFKLTFAEAALRCTKTCNTVKGFMSFYKNCLLL